MEELRILTAQRDEVLAQIREIEASCEGIENENNARRVQALNLEHTKLTAQKGELQAKLSAVQGQLSAILAETAKLSAASTERILEAIKKQRWYFFKNKTKVLMDRNTGLLWASLDYFPWCRDGNPDQTYDLKGAQQAVKDFRGGEIDSWVIPKFDDFKEMVADKSFPYREGVSYSIKARRLWYCDMNGYSGDGIDLSNLSVTKMVYFVIPCSSELVRGSDYKNDVSPSNHVYTKKERLQRTLDLFLQHELWPIFNEEEITELYRKIYFEKPKLLEKLQELQSQIEDLQRVRLLSSDFDYRLLLAKYDIEGIDTSIIRYYQALRQWTEELLGRLDEYEQEMESVIRDFNLISLKLSKKYEDNPHLTKEENTLLAERQRYFQKKFSLGMHSVKSKLLAVKNQADELEYRIDEIDNGEDAIHELAALEKEDRASFVFVAENTAKIVKNALLKIEFFQENHPFVMNAIDIWEKWSEDYRVFKATYQQNLKSSCEDDGIEEEVWSKWYENWQGIRFAIEQKVQPIIERGLKTPMPTAEPTKVSVPERLLAVLDEYKDSIDRFFLEERKGIYQKFVFQSGGELQEKFETEGELYKCTTSLQSSLQEIVFSCLNAEDRVFILKWANSLLDIQIDEILDFVADNDLQKISREILSEFAALKRKNYDIYLSDAKTYAEEKSRREKEYNSLMFRMRKDLMKQ